MESRLGKLVRGRRLEMGLSQKAVGKMVGVSGQQIHNIETGKTKIPGPDTLGPLARVLGFAERVLLQAAGYLRSEDGENNHAVPTPGRLWNELVARFDGDEEAARRALARAISQSYEDQ